MLKKLFNIIIAVVTFCATASAQEISCKIKVMHEKITGVDNEVFNSMERNINSFINSRKWTTDEFGPNEKIECNIMLNITGRMAGDNDGFNATMNISAGRPVYNSSYTSPTINWVDRDLLFHYSQYTTMDFDDNRVSGNDPLASNLTAVLAYYVYIILALDYDSFAKEGGTVYLKKAQNIVNNAPEQGKTITGWKAVEGNRNRYWLIDQMMSPRFESLRSAWYSIHREGLDNLYSKPAEARQKVLSTLTTLQQVQKENPSSVLMQFIFSAKSDEFIRVVSMLPRPERAPYLNLLSQIDVLNAAKYNSLK
jgi:hypothetical protein